MVVKIKLNGNVYFFPPFANANPMPTTALIPNAKAPAIAIPLCASEINKKKKNYI